MLLKLWVDYRVKNSKLSKLDQTRFNSDRVYEFDESYKIYWLTVPTLLFAHSPTSPFPFAFYPNLTFSNLNLSTASISNANLGLGFCWGRRQGGWERGEGEEEGSTNNANWGLEFCRGCRRGRWERGRERKRGIWETENFRVMEMEAMGGVK